MDSLLNLTPVLPAAGALRWALPLFWCVIVVWWLVAALGLTRRLPRPFGRGVVVAAAAWALMPVDWSIAYGLGLAFQLPSLVAVVLCASVLAALALPIKVIPVRQTQTGNGPTFVLLVLGSVLGWLLLLDTLAVWPVHLYALGYGTGALAVFAAAGAVLWFWAGNTLPGLVLPVALALYVGLRLPTGNVFDAVLDPWLWAWAQFSLLRRGLPALTRRFAAATTPD